MKLDYQLRFMLGGGFWVWLIPIILLALIILSLVKIFTNNKKKAEPIEILKQRYAQGEITRDNYLKMKDEIIE